MRPKFTEFQILMAIHKESGDGNPRAKFHASRQKVARALGITIDELIELMDPLEARGLVVPYLVKRRFEFMAYRLTEAGEKALGLK